ncbi:MAG: hypothetical protein V1709_08075 [Planctomycetota bacterium]
MSFEKKFELKLYVPVTWEVAGDMPDRWANGLKNAAEVINDRRQAKIPDDGTFNSEMAIPANKGYVPFVASGFISKSDRSDDGIKGSHAKNVTTAFNFWNDKINKAYATVDGIVAKEFKEKVDDAKVRWALRVADKTLRFTGDKIRGRSVAPIATYYLVGDERASGWIRPSDFADGTPYNIAGARERVALKTAIQQRLVQGGQMVSNLEYTAAALLAENTVNASLLSRLRDTAKCDAFVAVPAPDKCFCAWALDGSGLLYLHVQVGLTTP